VRFVSFCRHRAVNLFLQGYERVWLKAEHDSPEDRLIEDLAVSVFLIGCVSQLLSHDVHVCANPEG